MVVPREKVLAPILAYAYNLKHHLCDLHLDYLHNGGQQTPCYIFSPRTFMGSGNMFRGESGSYEDAIFTGR